MIPDIFTKVVSSNKLEFQYESAKEILSDFELMFQNCLTYNPPGSDITIITKIVQKFFNERVDWMNQLERTKIEIVIEPKEYLPKKSRGWPRAEFGGHGQLRGGKSRGMPATGKLVAWQT